MRDCLSENQPDAVDDLRLAVHSLAAFPARNAAGGAAVTERLAAVAELCRSVDAVLDSLVVQAAAEAAEEGWTAARMATEQAAYYARLQRALLPASVGAGLTQQ
ncbi:hypothetical protein [Kitasatospora aureofaciens]|uniref:hypothetical protein n=1 Tax=Kitasatospora aureofaciens TaxID=1894 RepID=UPI001C464800|nr:hypothetical protein [Kitasatospora aureofaciens]MBV6698037.1 hypothetical protein [Kitasatospora aureofaciens]